MNVRYKNSEGKIFGTTLQNTFWKNVKKSKHLFRKLNAWAIDKGIVDDLINNGIQTIVIHEDEENINYEISVKDFVEKGIEGEFPECGKQIFLPLENFERKKDENREKALLEKERSKNGDGNS
jgi:hypothetical protein